MAIYKKKAMRSVEEEETGYNYAKDKETLDNNQCG